MMLCWSKEPEWHRLQDKSFCERIVHIGNYHDLQVAMQPNSIARMAAFISIIRPGKAHLQRKPWADVFATVWDGDDTTGFVFKKSHAVSYARLVALHINLLCRTSVILRRLIFLRESSCRLVVGPNIISRSLLINVLR